MSESDSFPPSGSQLGLLPDSNAVQSGRMAECAPSELTLRGPCSPASARTPSWSCCSLDVVAVLLTLLLLLSYVWQALRVRCQFFPVISAFLFFPISHLGLPLYFLGDLSTSNICISYTVDFVSIRLFSIEFIFFFVLGMFVLGQSLSS